MLPELIRAFFADYLHLVEPDAARRLRLDCVTFSEKSCASLVAAEVPARKGEPVTAVVRIEPRPVADGERSRELAAAFKTLDVRYGQPVLLSVLHLSGGRPGTHLESAMIGEALGIEMARIFYTAFGLEGARAEHYLERPEPLAWALAARMRPARRNLKEHRRACLAKIAAADLDEPRRTLLRRAVDEKAGAGSGRRPAP